jgi:hypothetical protein
VKLKNISYSLLLRAFKKVSFKFDILTQKSVSDIVKNCQIEVEKGLRKRENVGQFHVFLTSCFPYLKVKSFRRSFTSEKKCSFLAKKIVC